MVPLTLHPPSDILVVDDTPANLQLLGGMLKERGHKVRPVPSGELALQAAASSPPDLILLDIRMPGMDGFEVCRLLKQNEATRDIPVIFISALHETNDKVHGFGLGGVDYVTIPFQFEEVDARVTCHLKLRRLQLELAARNEELRQSNEHLRQLQEFRDNLTHMIVHDLRSPLNGVLGAIDFVAENGATLSPSARGLLTMGRDAGRQVLEMINSLLDVGKIEAGELRPNCTENDLADVAREAVELLGGLHDRRTIVVESAREPWVLSFDRGLILRVIQNLVSNALKFTRETGSVRLSLTPAAAGFTRCAITDDGPGIPPEFHQSIFDKFGQAKSSQNRVGTGLGLTFCKLVVEAHGGRIGVESAVGCGSTFWFELPQERPAEPA